MAVPEISVIIPSYNEATYIDRLLDALERQSFKDFEVIVSDAESNDGTPKAIESFKNRLDVRLVSAPPKGPGFGRNLGAEAAHGEWLLFLDADVDVDDKDFMKTLLGGTIQHGWTTSSAKMRVNSKKLQLRFGAWSFYHYQKLLAHTRHPVAQGFCILTRRDVFKKHNGFNEKIHYGEDNDYVSRAGRGAFGFVDDTYYYVDMRRSESEGLWFSIKNFLHEIYRLTHLNSLENQPFKYEFGQHKERRR